MPAYLHVCQESNVGMWRGVEEHYFNTRLCIYASDLAHTIALGVTKNEQQNIICSNLPSSVINRNRNRKESEGHCLSKCTLVH